MVSSSQSYHVRDFKLFPLMTSRFAYPFACSRWELPLATFVGYLLVTLPVSQERKSQEQMEAG